MPTLRILIADDHALVRQGIRMLIEAQSDMEVIGEAGDGETAWRMARDLRPDVVLMDVSMPVLNGAQATERLQACCREVRVLALSAYSDEEHIRRLLASGAAGYVLKKAIAEELTGAIRAVAQGGVHLDSSIAAAVVDGYVHPMRTLNGENTLSPREHEVLQLVAWGHTNKEIAANLHLSVKTVEGHKTRGMEKLGAGSRSDVVRFALRHGWLQQE